jgi:hypothetical protein
LFMPSNIKQSPYKLPATPKSNLNLFHELQLLTNRKLKRCAAYNLTFRMGTTVLFPILKTQFRFTRKIIALKPR